MQSLKQELFIKLLFENKLMQFKKVFFLKNRNKLLQLNKCSVNSMKAKTEVLVGFQALPYILPISHLPKTRKNSAVGSCDPAT